MSRASRYRRVGAGEPVPWWRSKEYERLVRQLGNLPPPWRCTECFLSDCECSGCTCSYCSGHDCPCRVPR